MDFIKMYMGANTKIFSIVQGGTPICNESK